MKVLLVNPTKERLFEQPSLGLLYIAAALRKAGHQVEYLEGSEESLSVQISWRVKWKSLMPDVIGFTVMSPMFNDVADLVRMVKHECWRGSGKKQPVLIAGGAHATLMPETLLEAGVDYVIQGEGERAIVDLLSAKIIPGIKTIHYQPVENLDKLEFPARDLLPKKYRKRHAASIVASRGCPYNCSFCQPTLRRMFGSRVRKRTVNSVIDEMISCGRTYGIQYFEFFDDTFTADKAWLHEFCETLFAWKTIQHIAAFPRWECLTRVNAVDEEMLSEMELTGCRRITFGVESGSQEILDYYRKGITLAQIREAFRLCKKVGIHTHALFMLGAPMETQETIRATEDLIKEIKPDSIFISITTPLPFTDLWEDLMKSGNVTLDWSQINYYQKPALKLLYMQPGEIVAARERILKGFYLRHPGFLLKFVRARGWSYTKTAFNNLFSKQEPGK